VGTIRISLAVCGACLLATTTQGSARQHAGDGTSATYNACMASGDAARGITLGINNCTGAEIDRQDAALNRTYKAVLARLSPARQADLRAAERKWIPARDRRCTREMGDEAGGTLGDIMYRNCILYETINRTAWLKRYR
jgi:uncharacterized protein YecT (DUF1311 family)